MKRLTIKLKDCIIMNIPCDRIEEDGKMLRGYYNGELVAMSTIGTFDCAHISEQKEGSRDG